MYSTKLGDFSTATISYRPARPRPEFIDVSSVIQKLTSEDSYLIGKWLLDFEAIVDSSQSADEAKLFYARRLISSYTMHKSS